MFDPPDDIDEISIDAMEYMFEDAVELALKCGSDSQAFISSFMRCAADGKYEFFDAVFEQANGTDVVAQAAWPLAISIWNAMPLPCNNYQPSPIAKPRRNEPCRCGSGRKFKQCCARLGDVVEFPIEQNMMTKYLLEALPATKLRNVWRHLPHQLIGVIAGEWANLDWDEAKRTLVMLDPIFKQSDANLNYRDEAAFDAVIEACNFLDKPRKKKVLIERLSQHLDKQLRAAALHRKCCMLSDDGNYDAAWLVFREAQRADPDNPGLSHLEVLILLNQGKIEQMRQRGRYWIKRLTHMDAEAYANLIDWIQTMIDSPVEGMGNLMEMQTPGTT